MALVSLRFFLAGVAVTILILALAAWVSVTLGLVPVNGDSQPSTLEHWAARTALIAGVERRMGRGKNPSFGGQAILDGIRVYKNRCEVCHGGLEGSHESAIASGLYQRPPQFGNPKEGMEDVPYAYTSWVVKHGIRLTGMPAFGKTLSPSEINNVALFLRRMNTLTANERYAFNGAPLRKQLVPLYREIGGWRHCVYRPSPRSSPLSYVIDAEPTFDGSFILEQLHDANGAVVELSVYGLDKTRQRYIRLGVSNSGSASLSTSDGESQGMWKWGFIDASHPIGSVNVLTPHSGISYAYKDWDKSTGFCGVRAAALLSA